MTWCRERGGKCHLGMLLRSCFLGLESRLCLPACSHLLKVSRGHCRVITKDFCTLGLVSLGSSLEVAFAVPRGLVGQEVVMEFSSRGESEKSQSMWNIIKAINQEQVPPSCQAQSQLCPWRGTSPALAHKCSKADGGHRPRVTAGSAPGSLPKELCTAQRAGKWNSMHTDISGGVAHTYNLHYLIFRGHNDH